MSKLTLEDILEEIKNAGRNSFKISIKEIRFKAEKNEIPFPVLITKIYKQGLINVLVE